MPEMVKPGKAAIGLFNSGAQQQAEAENRRRLSFSGNLLPDFSVREGTLPMKNPNLDMRFQNAVLEGYGGGGVVGRVSRKVLGEFLEEAAKRADDVGDVISPAAAQRLEPLVEEGILGRGLFEALSTQRAPLFDRVTRAASEAGIEDVPVYGSLAELPKRGRAIIGDTKEPAIREANEVTSLVGRLLGSRFPGSSSAKTGWDPAAVARNAEETILTGERLFGDIADKLSPTRAGFYPMFLEQFLDPLSKRTILSPDALAQLGASLSPLKLVPMEIAQTAELAKRLSDPSVRRTVPSLTKGMKEMGLGQLIKSQTKNALGKIDAPSHTRVTPANISKIVMYALNKSNPQQARTIDDLIAYTFDTWQRRALGFAEDALPREGKQYRDILGAIEEGITTKEAIESLERQLRKAGYSADEARRMARVPNIGQAVVWSDARNQIGDVIGRLFG